MPSIENLPLSILFALGISYILATAYVFFGDVRHLYGVVTTLWMYLSALFYPIDRLSGFMQKVVMLNPIFNYIDGMRCLVLFNTFPPFMEIMRMACYGIVMYFLGRQIFLNQKNKIMQRL
mgnify:CR=1 FL=1